MNIDNFLNQLGISQNPQDIYLGGIRLIDVPEISDKIIKQSESKKNTILQVFEVDELTQKLAQISQLITFEEYIALFDINTAHNSPIFNKLNLNTIDKRYLFTQRHENTLQGYQKFIQTHYPNQALFFLKWLHAHISEKERMKHTYIVGGSRSGKSELLKILVHDYIKLGKHSIVVLDPSGKLSNQIVRFKEFLDPKIQEKLVFFDPYLGHSLGCYPIINPFEFKSKDVFKLDRATDELTRAINQILIDESAEFSQQMALIVKRMVAVLLFKGNADFSDLVRFFYEDSNNDLIDIGKNHPNIKVREFFTNRWGIDKGLNTSITPLKTRIESLTDSMLFSTITTGKSTIRLEEFLDSGKYVIFNLSKGDLSEYLSKAIGKLVLAQIQILSLQRQEKHPASYKPVHVFVDEMQNYITQSVEQILTESAKYKIYLTLVNQYIGQSDRDAGANQFYKALLGNTGVKIIGNRYSGSKWATYSGLNCASNSG